MADNGGSDRLVFEDQGILVTVAAFLLVVEYVGGGYDWWDAAIAVAAGWFSFGYLTSQNKGDTFANMVASFVLAVSSKVALLSIASGFGFQNWILKKEVLPRVIPGTYKEDGLVKIGEMVVWTEPDWYFWPTLGAALLLYFWLRRGVDEVTS